MGSNQHLSHLQFINPLQGLNNFDKLPNKNGGPQSATLQTEISNKLRFGKLQILTRGKDGTIITIDNSRYKDVIIRQDTTIDLKSTPEPNLKVESTALKRNTNTAYKSSSLDANNEAWDDKVVTEMEVNTVKKILKNREINVDECYKWEVVELDEKDKAFMRSLGWVENEVVEPLTQDEIDAFINKFGKLRAKSKFSDRRGANSSAVQTS